MIPGTRSLMGSEALYDMMDRVRMMRTGKKGTAKASSARKYDARMIITAIPTEAVGIVWETVSIR